MITGTTKSGFAYEIPDTVGDNYEVLECVAKLQNENDVLALPMLVDLVLGDKQRDAFKEHCRGEDGRISTEYMMREFFDIFAQNAATKK